MTYTENLWLFFSLLFGIVIVPGVDMIFVLANALTHGRSAGLFATAGIIVGSLLFRPLLIVGALYMAWIGFTLMRSSITVDQVRATDARSNGEAFRRGIVSCLMNPKAYLFMLAVYPQFLRPDFGPLAPQAAVMAAMTAATLLFVYGGLSVAAGRAREVLVGNGTATIWVGRAAGLLLILVSLVTLWEGVSGGTR
ncbi:LysE family translocator [Rhizobium laguerreae]|uniref:LysE family translocator n=1 Tax=Rhizobium laguerreae TaxID=1076926 RepID=UPI001C908DA0|nr:LysE family translocator [Rhizobium laguerreae]MBY3223262.1 LysE family translocator [Rhizobium laguerreae]